MDKTEQFVQIVLAAGESKRMGRPKSLLEFGGLPLLRRVVDAAQGAGVPHTIVVLGPGGSATPARVDLLDRSVAWVTNPVLGSPQLASLQCALEALPKTAAWFLFQPVDYPLVTATDYRLLLDAASAPGADTVFFLSHGRRKGHPVLCRRSVGSRLLELGPESSARDVLSAEQCRYVSTENDGVLEDMDRPEDYERLKRTFAQRREGKGA